MRAVVHDRYGPPEVLYVDDVPRPVPSADEVLVEVRASSVTRTDCGFRAARPFFIRVFTGVRRPKRRTTGMELAGVVAELGANVQEFAVGDEVFGIRGGANAEYVCVRETGVLTHKPASMSFEEAAVVCDGALLALSCLRPAGLREGQSLLVYGASGSIGTAAVQLARHFETDVTAVCDAKSVELVRSLGADRVIDYTKEDFTKNGEIYDVVFDAVGKHSFRRARGSVKPGGIFVTTDLGFLWHVPLVAVATRWIGNKRGMLGRGRYERKDLLLVRELMEAGRYRAVIDRTYPLEQVVEATRYVETGRKTGNVVLTLEGEGR
jgi:NADPH:quinone reductase-like Zn-dependent oxidoreductase